MDVTCCSAPSTLFPFCLGSANEREVAGLWAHQVLMGISYKLDGLVGEQHTAKGAPSLVRNFVRKDGSGLNSNLAQGSCSPLGAEPKGRCVFVLGAGVFFQYNACSGYNPVIYSTWIVFVRRYALCPKDQTGQCYLPHRTSSQPAVNQLSAAPGKGSSAYSRALDWWDSTSGLP